MNNVKQVYHSPIIIRIKLDQEISLQLDSTPPKAPNEASNRPEYFNNDPFKNNV